MSRLISATAPTDNNDARFAPAQTQDPMALARILTRKDGGLKKLITYQLFTYCLPGLIHTVSSAAKHIVSRQVSRRVEQIQIVTNRNKQGKRQEKTSSITLSREYNEGNNNNNDRSSNTNKRNDTDNLMHDVNLMFDAIMNRVAEMATTKHLNRTSSGMYIMSTSDPIEFLPYVFVRKVSERNNNNANTCERLDLEVFTYTYDLTSLRKQLQELEDKFKMMIANNLGKHIYFFDEMIMPLNSRRGIVRPTSITFKHYPLHTNKKMDNIYGDAVKIIRKRVEFFMNNKKWYEEKGVPYTLGLLFHGVPGSGKTSTIKGIASATNRHVFNIRVTRYTTVNQLNNLFYAARVNVLANGQTQAFDIPIDQRIIVMEDIDCLESVVNARKGDINDIDDIANKEHDATDGIIDGEQTLTLSHLLNILDGVLEQPGRILIVTTNFPEKLDPALVRPGRIDAVVCFEKCKRHEIVEMVKGLADHQIPVDRARHLADMVYTPAEVAKIVFEHMHDPDRMTTALSVSTLDTQMSNYLCWDECDV